VFAPAGQKQGNHLVFLSDSRIGELERPWGYGDYDSDEDDDFGERAWHARQRR
jgi:hypothetical protein